MNVAWAVLWAAAVMVGVSADQGEKDVKAGNEAQGQNERQFNNFSTPAEPSATSPGPPTGLPPTHPPPHHSRSRPVDCADHLMAGAKTSGVYEIYPFTCSCSKPVLVWCDMETDGGGWTIFLSRQDTSPWPQVNFNRTWQEYKDGFGSPYNEYYLGNELLHVMTQSRAYTLRLNVQQVSGGISYGTFETIRIADEDSRYQITLSGSQHGTSSMTYCFRYLNYRYFTTLDYNSDSANCVAKKGGGWWWYNSCNFFNPTAAGFNTSMQLVCYNLKLQVTKLQLMLRPQICDSSFKTIHLKDMDCNCLAAH